MFIEVYTSFLTTLVLPTELCAPVNAMVILIQLMSYMLVRY